MTENERAGKVLREVECRVVWLTSFLTLRKISPTSGTVEAAKAADSVLDEYEARFKQIPPDGLP